LWIPKPLSTRYDSSFSIDVRHATLKQGHEAENTGRPSEREQLRQIARDFVALIQRGAKINECRKAIETRRSGISSSAP
jgi:hypothetical protein